MKESVISIVIRAIGIITEKLLKGLENMEKRGKVETIQMKA